MKPPPRFYAGLIAGLLFFARLALGQSPGPGPAAGGTAADQAPREKSAEKDAAYPVRVEVKLSMEGRTAAATTAAAVAAGKDQALMEYISQAVPPALLVGKEEAVKALLKDRDRYIISYEVTSSKVEDKLLIMGLVVNLDARRLDTALRQAGLTPRRNLPRTFVVVTGKLGPDELKSGWVKAAGAPGQFNGCEARIALEFERYGFELIRPEASAPPIVPATVVSPEGPEEKARVFQELREKYNAGALVIGQMSSAAGKDGQGSEKWEITLKIAAVDVREERVVYSGQAGGKYPLLTGPDRERAMDGVCGEASAKAVEALFAELMPSFAPGERREIAVVIKGLDSYARMKEIERRLKQESPGVESVTLTRMGRGEIEFLVATTVDAKALAHWLATNQFEGLSLTAEASDDTHVTATALGAGPGPPAAGSTVLGPGPGPGGTADKPAVPDGSTAEKKPAPQPGATAEKKPAPQPGASVEKPKSPSPAPPSEDKKDDKSKDQPPGPRA